MRNSPLDPLIGTAVPVVPASPPPFPNRLPVMTRSLLLSGLALVLGLCVAARAPVSHAQVAPDDASASERPQNVILLIPDGYGPATATMARDYLRWRDGTTSLALDSLHRGSVRTFAADSRVTDSAAGATAYSAATKTYNGAIAVDTTKQPVATILEAAEARGMATGLVVTSRLTHATPATFSAHVPDRWMENTIAEQQLAQGIDVLLGGGRRHFVPQSVDGSKREDDRNLLAEAQASGYTVVQDADGFRQADATPLLGLFSLSHMSYEMDRDPAAQPSLAEMTQKALDLLSSDEDGYFLMVEASRIDHAGHDNDASAHLFDTIAFDEAVETALAHAKAEGNTLVVSVADHETGGLSLGRDIDGEGIYAWEPEALDRVTASHGVILDSLAQAVTQVPAPEEGHDPVVEEVMAPVLEHFTGITDLTDSEVTRLREEARSPYALNFVLSDIIGRRAIVGWTTRGHTAVDVHLHAFGPGYTRFTGNHDNTYVGATLADLLGLDLDALTATLRDAQTSDTPTTGSR